MTPEPDVWVPIRQAHKHPALRAKFFGITADTLQWDSRHRHQNGAAKSNAIKRDPSRKLTYVHIGRFIAWKERGLLADEVDP